MRAIITVVGKDRVGILAKVSSICAENSINVMDVTQTILQDLFTMIMLVDMTDSHLTCADLSDRMDSLSTDLGLSIHVMHEGIFNAMHRI